MMADLLLSISHNYSVSQIMRYLKGKSVMMIFESIQTWNINMGTDTLGQKDIM